MLARTYSTALFLLDRSCVLLLSEHLKCHDGLVNVTTNLSFTILTIPQTAILNKGETQFREYLSLLFGIMHILTKLLYLFLKR